MKSMLALEHQLEKVDYTKKNFVHADMSPDQFLQAMKDRNEGFLQMYMRLLGQSLGAAKRNGRQGRVARRGDYRGAVCRGSAAAAEESAGPAIGRYGGAC